MQPEIYTINLTVPAEWDKLDDHQLRYVSGQLAQGFPSPLALPQVLRLSHETKGSSTKIISAVRSAGY